MTTQEKIDEIIRQLATTKSKQKQKELYKALRRAEGQRRKEKLEKEFR